jgi:hypothetical protein
MRVTVRSHLHGEPGRWKAIALLKELSCLFNDRFIGWDYEGGAKNAHSSS